MTKGVKIAVIGGIVSVVGIVTAVILVRNKRKKSQAPSESTYAPRASAPTQASQPKTMNELCGHKAGGSKRKCERQYKKSQGTNFGANVDWAQLANTAAKALSAASFDGGHGGVESLF